MSKFNREEMRRALEEYFKGRVTTTYINDLLDTIEKTLKGKECICGPYARHPDQHDNPDCPLYVEYPRCPKKEEVPLPDLLIMPDPKKTKHRELYGVVNQLIRYLRAKESK